MHALLRYVGLLGSLGVHALLRYVGLRLWKSLELLRLLGLRLRKSLELLRLLGLVGVRPRLGLLRHEVPGSGGPVVPAGLRGMVKLTYGLGVLVLVR
ncbi:hypothetical protein [Streptomyces sp. NRRL S-378]|uniref:hypothetical protein n=1 Tax=Streptomyces sp. NRRL S-378 TaxID=1463904 RepID=UPI00131CB944|nr:hypothetical protein [Streptomyces sp. NRRL S-378]